MTDKKPNVIILTDAKKEKDEAEEQRQRDLAIKRLLKEADKLNW